MSRLTESDSRGLMDAYRSIYEGYGKKKKGKKKVMHNCATHVEHSEYGLGNCIKEMHTLDEEGNVSHYDVEFEHGIVENVPVSELNILVSEDHPHEANELKNAEVLDEDLIGDVLANRGKIKAAATRAVTATNRAASSTNKALGTAVSDTVKQAQTGVRQTAKDVAKGFQYGGATGAATALGANIVRGIASSGQSPKPRVGNIPSQEGTGRGAPGSRIPLDPNRFDRERERLKGVGTPPVKRATLPVPTKPVSAPAAAKPAPTAPAAKPAASVSTTASKPITAQPAVSKSQADAAEIRGMIGRSMERQADEVKRTAEIAKKTTQPAVAPGYQGAKKPFAEEVDAYDLILEYLFDNGHVDTLEEALYVMLEMDSEMIQDIAEAKRKSYSAKKARKGEDIGLPGKGFEKIASSAGKRYGSKKRGEKVAGAVLAGLRAKYGK